MFGRVERAVPCGGQFGDHALRLKFVEQAAQGLAERDAGSHLRHLADVEPLRAELTAAGGLAFSLAPGQFHVPLRPAHAVAGQKAQALHVEHHALGVALRDQPALDLLEGERVDRLRQPKRHRAQRHVDGRGLRLPVLQFEPAAQRTHALAQLEGQRHVLAQRVQVGARQARIGVATPAPPVATARQQRLGEAGADVEAVAPFGRWRGVEMEVVLQQAVADHQLHVAQHQRRGSALLVGPAQRAAADHELVLLEEPVGDRVAVAAVVAADIEPRHKVAALRVAPQLELRAVDQQLFEAQFQRKQRARRDRGEDARQAERRPLFCVEHDHVAQLQRRHPATRPHLDLADANGYPQGLAGPCFDRLTPLLDVGQNRPVQGQPGDQQHAGRRGQHHQNEARRPAQERPMQQGRAGSGWVSGRLGQRGRG